MSTVAIRNHFLAAYNMPIDGNTYYIHNKNVYKNEIFNKALTINGEQYLYSDHVRNSMYLLKAIRSAYDSFIAEGSNLFQYVCDANDDDTLAVSGMFETVCNGLWTLYSDFVKYFARMPITDEFMDAFAAMTSSYVAGTYNAILKRKDYYDSEVYRIQRDTRERFESYNRMSREKADSIPKSGTFFGNAYKDIFGTTQVYGSMHVFSNYTAGDAYIDMAANKVLAESGQQKDLTALKDAAMDDMNGYIKQILPAYRKGIYELISEKNCNIFHADTFFYTGIEDRPFVIEKWRDRLADIPEADYNKLKRLFEFYNMSIHDGIIVPLYQMIVDELTENGDFDSYNGKLMGMYSFFSGYDSLRKDFSFPYFLKDYIIGKIDKQYEALDPDKVPYNDNTFGDIYEAAEKNPYLKQTCISDIYSHISRLKTQIFERRGRKKS